MCVHTPSIEKGLLDWVPRGRLISLLSRDSVKDKLAWVDICKATWHRWYGTVGIQGKGPRVKNGLIHVLYCACIVEDIEHLHHKHLQIPKLLLRLQPVVLLRYIDKIDDHTH